jgi:carbohydrate kinase (thermoresistant glucokinase family)
MPPPWITRDCFIVVMGVSGAGKSAISGRLASALQSGWIEGDTLHSAENKERIRRGIPLTDALRWPWLAAICDAAEARKERPLVIACSALKRSYRDFIRGRLAPVRFLFLDGPADLIAARMRARKGHFATVELLQSQLAELEPPTPDENALRVDIARSPDEIVQIAREATSPS